MITVTIITTAFNVSCFNYARVGIDLCVRLTEGFLEPASAGFTFIVGCYASLINAISVDLVNENKVVFVVIVKACISCLSCFEAASVTYHGIFGFADARMSVLGDHKVVTCCRTHTLNGYGKGRRRCIGGYLFPNNRDDILGRIHIEVNREIICEAVFRACRKLYCKNGCRMLCNRVILIDDCAVLLRNYCKQSVSSCLKRHIRITNVYSFLFFRNYVKHVDYSKL